MNAWDVLLSNSSAGAGSDAWEHLNSSVSGETVIIAGELSSSITNNNLTSSVDMVLSSTTSTVELTSNSSNTLTSGIRT